MIGHLDRSGRPYTEKALREVETIDIGISVSMKT